ncbi:DUF4136 domain-containing protein [uncultured Maribacter sp.]|uniref:DUF4136 domain-containing protein n=1 Tax=uncultured Maribacter sp. TaxID=431308 RepID=UPI00260ADC62|nr:DUF4136 domain-containing protein [uncultured Maribacter sp.]
MKRLVSLLFVIVLYSCSSVRVHYDYEKAVDFTSYTTYNYFSDLNTGLGELDTKRLLKSLDIVLQSKGMLFSEEPDFYINIESDLYHAVHNNTAGLGVGGTGNSVGGGISVGIPIGKTKNRREIIFNFVDYKKDVLFWEAVSIDTYKENQTPAQREMHIQTIVNKVLNKYPPKGKRK